MKQILVAWLAVVALIGLINLMVNPWWVALERILWAGLLFGALAYLMYWLWQKRVLWLWLGLEATVEKEEKAEKRLQGEGSPPASQDEEEQGGQEPLQDEFVPWNLERPTRDGQ